MIRILLIRHGNTDLLGRVLYGRTPGIHLNAEGTSQARSVGQALKDRYQLHEVISSPMERALETAKWIAEPQGRRINVDQGLTEIDFGSWTGKRFTELEEMGDWKRYNRFRSLTSTPGGESMLDVQSRASRVIERIRARYGEDREATVAAVTHGDVLRSLLLLLLGMPIDNIHRLEIAPASVTEIHLEGAHPTVRSINLILYDETRQYAT